MAILDGLVSDTLAQYSAKCLHKNPEVVYIIGTIALLPKIIVS